MKDIVMPAVRRAGAILLEHYGHVQGIRLKESPASLVTDADLASEASLLQTLREHFPHYNILSEEAGYTDRQSRWTWVIDPLDGTSNFAASVPWFGVMVSLLDGPRPVWAAMYLPVEDSFYIAESGGGAWRNGERVHVTAETRLSHTLCAHSLDPRAEWEITRQEVTFLGHLVRHARNVRCTNSLVDFTLTIDGRFGACVNHSAKLWDLAAPALLLREAGGVLTDVRGREIAFDLSPGGRLRSYRVMAAGRALLGALVELSRASGLDQLTQD